MSALSSLFVIDFVGIESGVAWRARGAPDAGAAREGPQSACLFAQVLAWLGMLGSGRHLHAHRQQAGFQTRQSRFVKAAR